MKLVDTLAEQERLESLIDDTKPAVPPECAHLHWLLYTPFRYPARFASRFRRAGAVNGVFYAGFRLETAVAETAFWRLLFFAESPGLPLPANALEFTAFSVRIRARRCIDLTRAPHDAREADWTHPTDYTPCHDLADRAREDGCDAILYTSVHDPAGGRNLAVLHCAAFADHRPRQTLTWRLSVNASRVLATRDDGGRGMAFHATAFAADPRIARLAGRAEHGTPRPRNR